MRQFTIRRLMLVIAAVALALWLVRAHTFAAVVGFEMLSLAGVAWFPARDRPGLAAWGFFATATWLCGSLVVLTAFLPVFHSSMFLFLASIAFVPVVPGFGLAWAATREGGPRKAAAGGVVMMVMAFAVSTIATQWPFRLAFYLASPALNRVADRVEGGGGVGPGEWAGVYPIRGSLVRGGDTVLLVDPSPGGVSGFVRRKGSAGGAGREWLQLGPGKPARWSFLDED